MAKRTQVTIYVLAALSAGLHAQTTQGLISGRLLNSLTGRPVAAATIEYTGPASGVSRSDESGFYNLPLLSPGIYRVRVTAAGFQSQEVQQLELRVASRIEIDFRVRPLSDVWESGQYNSVFLPGSRTIVTFFGPDVDSSRSGSFEAQKGKIGSLQSSVSEVIDSAEIDNLPLAGRDVYTLLVTQPGVTSDAATARGLGLAANGQRPSASNFLLDGLENNNYLITGPLVTVAPEAIQEYRISTNNFSAEYGRTSGFLANAITRSGSNAFHGVGYLYVINDALSANAFQDNLRGLPRRPDKEWQPGFLIGGPVLRNRLYFSSAYEYFRSGSRGDPRLYIFPNMPDFLDFTADSSNSRKLLTAYAPPKVGGALVAGAMAFAAPVEISRTLAIQRFDYSSRSDHVMARAMVSLLEQPDFIWTPYPDFISALHQNTMSFGITHTHTFRPSLTNEARAGYSDDDLHWNRPHSEVPTLGTFDGVTLPGSPAFYAYKNRNRSWEFLDNVIWARGRHLITAGGGLLLRGSEGFLTAGRDGQYLFGSILNLALDRPAFFRAAIQRTTLPGFLVSDSNRTYRYAQFFGFAQDTFKITSRLTANYGVRYELFGAPENTGRVKDALVTLGPSTAISTGARLFGTDKRDWAVRAGATYDLLGNARTLLRGGYGIFYDRPFDNLWQNLRNNDFVLPAFTLTSAPLDYLAPISTVLSSLQRFAVSSNFPDLTMVDPSLRNGYTESYFAGVQHRVAENLTLELNGLGSYGRRLVTTDIVNRDFSTPLGRLYPNLPDIAYRAGQGYSNYNALAAVVRYRASHGMAQATYTWSHTIDNQSEPLAGDFFNLNFTSIQVGGGSNGRAAFSRQFDVNADRGNSDFDQRHNLVLFGYWDFRRWIVSGIAGFRSGFPYNLRGTSATGNILNNRPNLVDPSAARQEIDVPGGRRLLNPAAFALADSLGSLGRNAFIGPGFYNVDLSVARSFKAWEAGTVTIRASAFNVLNHVNLGNPDVVLTSPTFGIAQFGRQGVQSGFPAVSPLNESARKVQLSLKFEF